jgi:hypothetical protein
MRTKPTTASALMMIGALLCQCDSDDTSSASQDAALADAPETIEAASGDAAFVDAPVAIEAASSDAAPDATLIDAANEAGAPLPFQPSNVTLDAITAQIPMAQTESVTSSCTVGTAMSNPGGDCFESPIVAATQPDGSSVNLVVVQSLTVAAGVTVRVTGSVPLVIVALGDITLSGTLDAHSASLNVGPGGGVPADSDVLGVGPGGGSAGSSTAAIGGSGGSFCGLGGYGGGSTSTATPAMPYGNEDDRPLAGGSSGGGGDVGSGAGGGAVQIVAGGTITVATGGAINAGGEGGPIGGLATDQNAGGGGSGGAILLEATTVVIVGNVAANGGGGGGDYANPDGADATADATPAAGGAGGTDDAAGGNGSAGSTPSGAAGTAGTGGLNSGGGGGGAGRIRINTSDGTAAITGVLSPSQMTACATVSTVRAAGTAP